MDTAHKNALDDSMHASGLISTADYDACLRVLGVLTGHIDGTYQDPSFKPLRKALVPFVQKMVAKFPTEPRRNRPGRSEATKKAQKERREAELAADRKLLETTKLRSERNKKLRSLLHGVPDGVAEQDVLMGVTPQALTDSSTSQADANAPASDVATTGPQLLDGLLHRPRSCYICKTKFRNVHHFYDMLCPNCAELNYTKRTKIVDLTGYNILVTGARVKIGYQAALKLLRCGALVIATTRFPADAERRFQAEGDYENWKDRIHIYGLDMRHITLVENFCQFIIGKYPHLDGIVNNACQTIRRPPKFYEHLVGKEREALKAADKKNNNIQLEWSSISARQSDSEKQVVEAAKQPLSNLASSGGVFELSQVPVLQDDMEQSAEAFPENTFDVNGQQIDLRSKTSWLLKLDEVQTPEMCEVMSVNSISPFILNSRLKAVLKKSPHTDRYIVNVSAMEGKFYRHKDVTHPHTNMAKAALNMMTRTSGADYAKDNIFMTAVDTGWINDENPVEKAQKIAQENNFQTPLDEIDAAARIIDPIISGVGDGMQVHSEFLKDYVSTEW